MKSVLLTGGAGFIGCNIARALVREGYRVTVLDNLATGHRGNLADLEGELRFIEGSINDPAALGAAMQGIELVLHQAAIPSVPRSIKDPMTSNQANVTGTLQVLEASREKGVKRLVYASSSSVYGDVADPIRVETMHPNPRSPYAVTKLAAEHYCRVYNDVLGLETVILRYFNIFGPFQDPGSTYAAVVPLFTRAALRNEPVTVFGDGTQSRDFTYVENVVRANLLAMEADGAGGEVMNVACGERYTVNDLVERIGGHVGRPLRVTYTDIRTGDILHTKAEIAKAGRILGYKPVVGFGEGLQRTVEWFRAHPEHPRPAASAGGSVKGAPQAHVRD